AGRHGRRRRWRVGVRPRRSSVFGARCADERRGGPRRGRAAASTRPAPGHTRRGPRGVVVGETGFEPIAAWLSVNVGGTIVRHERQARWRPVWFVDVKRDGELLELYV